jgi:type II secretory ATPase GspE/PulE/Tfp pilus assembly ATPase PilB-like protein
MVGEIRDKETAQLAIQAALTGHLVLSTIHTNNAVGVIPRLVDMGVDPYLIAPTLRLAMARRLVKKLCPESGKPMPIEGSIKKIIDEEFKDLPPEHRQSTHIPQYVYSAQPQPSCPKGTRGRVAVFEVMRMNRAIEQIVLEDANETKIYTEARKDGMLTMREDAIIKSFEKIVPFEEVNKLGSGDFAV